MNIQDITKQLKQYALSLNLLSLKVTACTLPEDRKQQLNLWLHRQITQKPEHWAAYGRAQNDDIVASAKNIILITLPYWQEPFNQTWRMIKKKNKAYISRMALGKNPHEILHEKIDLIARYLFAQFPDSFCYELTSTAPVSMIAIANQAGFGWRGKNALLIQKEAGSMYFLGMLLTDITLDFDPPAQDSCGTCTLCMDVCAGNALHQPYEVDRTRCISYWTRDTSELTSSSMRKIVGNRIYGCDDCQLICPFNRAVIQRTHKEWDKVHAHLNDIELKDLLGWSEETFYEKLAGSPILRIGYHKWLSNIIIAMGNIPAESSVAQILHPYRYHSDQMIRAAAQWAWTQHHNTQ